MKLHFFLRYTTRYGERISLSLGNAGEMLAMNYLNEDFWHIELDFDAAVHTFPLEYRYHLHTDKGLIKTEWGHDRRLDNAILSNDYVQITDTWNHPGSLENVFLTQPFREIFNPARKTEALQTPGAWTHIFRVKAPQLQADEVICLLGHGLAMRSWDTAAPVLLQTQGDWWEVRLDLSREQFPLAYKYGVWNTRTNKFLGFEEGTNRILYPLPRHEGGVLALMHDGFARLPVQPWRGAGVAIPVFSLRSANSFGVGEFNDLCLLADWAGQMGMKLIQLLPVNDSSAAWAGLNTKADFWTDSYPYSAISAFALHPIYLNAAAVAGKKYAEHLKPFAAEQQALNSLPEVDYEAVLRAKWKQFALLYEVMKNDWAKDSDYQAYFEENKHWLVPYAVFCFLRDRFGTSDFTQWPEHAQYDATAVNQLAESNSPHYDAIALHLFVQWHLHRQLRTAVAYVHQKGLALKGDIPIGIYRYSCDAWMAPELYNMNMQAGAPPDDFAEKGQNWGFPTYNWARMKQDGFAWWKQRFAQMSLYFDAFRIDHILGFFRIWSIPLSAQDGLLGYFVPALPVTEREFHEAGIGFNYNRLCKPFINDAILDTFFQEDAAWVKNHFLNLLPDAGYWSGGGQYEIKESFNTQEKVAAWYMAKPGNEPGKGSKKKKGDEAVLALSESSRQRIRDGMFNLIANVILLDVEPGTSPGDISDGWRGAFRIAMEKTSSFRHLPEDVRAKINALYVHYFYRRQDAFWEQEALEKLPSLKAATNMLVCGEDLGMVPGCVPDVMRDLGILSLEIQRMPKASSQMFFHPKDAPYLSVVTPSTHDMSTLRGWWEENRNLTQQFYHTVLGAAGTAPFFCEPWISEALIRQHLDSPAMLAIFQLQDLFGIDADIRRENPAEERINQPANPKHYWQYRMHLSLEVLMQSGNFNKKLQDLITATGRS